MFEFIVSQSRCPQIDWESRTRLQIAKRHTFPHRLVQELDFEDSARSLVCELSKNVFEYWREWKRLPECKQLPQWIAMRVAFNPWTATQRRAKDTGHNILRNNASKRTRSWARCFFAIVELI